MTLDFIQEFRRRRGVDVFEIPVDAIPYGRLLGISIAHKDGELLTRMKYGEHLIGNPVLPAVHGGCLGSLIEFAAMHQLIWEMASESLPKTINLTIEYMRPGRAEDFTAKAIVTKLGRRVANVQVNAWQSDAAKPVVAGIGHFLMEPSSD